MHQELYWGGTIRPKTSKPRKAERERPLVIPDSRTSAEQTNPVIRVGGTSAASTDRRKQRKTSIGLYISETDQIRVFSEPALRTPAQNALSSLRPEMPCEFFSIQFFTINASHLFERLFLSAYISINSICIEHSADIAKHIAATARPSQHP